MIAMVHVNHDPVELGEPWQSRSPDDFLDSSPGDCGQTNTRHRGKEEPILLWDRSACQADVHLHPRRGGHDPCSPQWAGHPGAIPRHDRAVPGGPRRGRRVHLPRVLGRRPLRPRGIAFVLGHALYMKAIHGGKATDIRSRDRSASFTGYLVIS